VPRRSTPFNLIVRKYENRSNSDHFPLSYNLKEGVEGRKRKRERKDEG